MSPDLEKFFCERWPQFFIHRDDPLRSRMGDGFCCEDGWHELLVELFSDIEKALATSTGAAAAEPLEIVQVKEKFGTLRVYAANATPPIYDLLDAATVRSRSICELCGAPGLLYIAGRRWATRCTRCAAQEEIALPADPSGSPQAGLFWAVNGRLVIVGTPVENAELWNQRYRNDPRSHQAQWREFQRSGIVPERADWADYPGSRVVYDTQTERFQMYADQCILNHPNLVAQIKAVLHLTADTPADNDDHYDCAVCRQRQ